MTTQATLPAAEFARAMERHHVEASDDMRRTWVGLQDTSNLADIYARHAHLYTPEQLAALADERDNATDPFEREQARRLWLSTAYALAERDLVQLSEDLMNEQLAWRTSLDGEAISFNGLTARLMGEQDFDRREQINDLISAGHAHFAPMVVELAGRSQQLRNDVFSVDGEVALASLVKGIDVPAFSDAISAVSDAATAAYDRRCPAAFETLLGRPQEHPSTAHAAYMRALGVFDEIFTADRMVATCMNTLSDLGFVLADIPTIIPDLEDRPQKNPRACVAVVKVPDEVHLVVRPTGGLGDYEAFLHEAGHALHYGLTDPQLPLVFRIDSPDNALTEIYSFVIERITHEPGWHMRHFGLDEQTATRVTDLVRFNDAALFRRYAAKLRYEIGFWEDPASPDNPSRYVDLLSRATNMTYSATRFASDMDAGMYSVDYLRAWRTSTQLVSYLRAQFGDEWYASRETGNLLRELFAQGVRPTNEEISLLIGSSPDDYSDLTSDIARG